jgi:hypothetical protein
VPIIGETCCKKSARIKLKVLIVSTLLIILFYKLFFKIFYNFIFKNNSFNLVKIINIILFNIIMQESIKLELYYFNNEITLPIVFFYYKNKK